jgi:acetyltransferase-like isoleucine patch superfamily enzyme
MIYDTAIISDRTVINMDETSVIGDYCLITVPYISIGKQVNINSSTKIIGRGRVYLGDKVSITYNCLLVTSSDQPTGKFMADGCDEAERDIVTSNIYICDGAYIGSYSLIMPGVIIGSNAVIGAYSYIDKDVPADTIVYPKQQLIFKNR